MAFWSIIHSLPTQSEEPKSPSEAFQSNKLVVKQSIPLLRDSSGIQGVQTRAVDFKQVWIGMDANVDGHNAK